MKWYLKGIDMISIFFNGTRSGQQTESLFNIMHGSYTLTVTDRLGCVEVFNFVVPMATSTEEAIAKNEIKVWPTVLSTAW